MNKALEDIRAERQKQIGKGYDTVHDDSDSKGSHARAAAYYATAAYYQRDWEDDCDASWDSPCDYVNDIAWQAEIDSVGYPWPSETKSVEYTPRANLVKAAALLIAEIERIDREESSND